MAEIILLSRDTRVHRDTIITALGTRVSVKIRYRTTFQSHPCYPISSRNYLA